MSRQERSAGIVLSYCCEAVRILTVLVYTPVLLRLLGTSEYGLYQLVTAVAANLGLLQFGFGSAYIRFFTRCRGEEERARLNGMFLLLFSVLAGLCLFCGGVLTANARLVFGPGLTAAELETAQKLLPVLVGTLALIFLNMPLDGYLTVREAFRFRQCLRLAQNVLSPFLTLPLLLWGYGAPALTMVSFTLTAGVLLLNIRHCRSLGMAVSVHALQWGGLKPLWTFAFFIFLNQLIDQINWSIDRFLLGRMMDTAAVAVYGIGGQINALYLQLSTAICAVFVPKVHRMAAQEGSNTQLTELMVRVGGLQLPVLLLVLSGFCFFGKSFLALWAGEGCAEAYAVALLLMTPMTVPLVQNLGLEILRARNRHRARSLVYAGLALGNLILSILLIPRWGPAGAAAGTAVTQTLGTVFFMNWYYQKKVGLDMMFFWKEMGRTLLSFLPVICLGALFASQAEIDSWGSLLGWGLLYVLAYGAVWLGKIKKRNRPKPVPQ